MAERSPVRSETRKSRSAPQITQRRWDHGKTPMKNGGIYFEAISDMCSLFPICEKNNMNKNNLSKVLQFYHPSGWAVGFEPVFFASKSTYLQPVRFLGRLITLRGIFQVSSFEAFPNTSPISPGGATIGF